MQELELEFEIEAPEDEWEIGPLYQDPGPPGTLCPTPAQQARDRCIQPGTQTCPAIPNLLCLRDAAGIPFEYVLGKGRDPATRLTIVNRRRVPSVEKFIPAVRDALASFLANMTRFGVPIEAILTLGSLYCRCVSGTDNLSNHSFGDAIDVAGVRWPPSGGPASAVRETVVYNWTDAAQRTLLRRINACLRLSFNTVIDYHRADHRDHFHCDTNSRGGSTRPMDQSRTTPHFTQEALTLVLGRAVNETGNWDRATMQGLRDFSGVNLTGPADPRINDVLTQLFTRIASGDTGAPAGLMGLDQFPFDSSALTPYHARLVKRIGRRVVASWQSRTPIRVIRLVGHADSTGPAAYNYGLGLRRAKAVQTALAKTMEKLRPGVTRGIRFLAHTRGAAHPVASSRTAPGRARNRRVTVSLNLPPPRRARQAEFQEFEGLWEAPPAAVAAPPPLLYSEATVLTETYYVKIAHGGEKPAAPMTGIFVPKDYKTPSQVDMVLWLQGHHKTAAYPPDLTIDTYWLATHYPNFAFREGVNISNKNVILVAPTLGPGSQSGNLIDSGGLARYLDQVLAALKAYGPFKTMSDPPRLGNLIVACHSGGGTPMLRIAVTPQRYLDKLQQCWGFDCLYNGGDETAWANWAKANPGKRLFIRYGNGGTAERSRRLANIAKGLSNVSVDGSESLAHNRVPITHWNNFLRAATFLMDR